MRYHATIKDIPEYTVCAYRTVLPTYATLMDLMPELGKKLTRLYPKLKCAEPEYCFNVYSTLEYQDHDIEVEICAAVTQAFPDKDGITFKKMPAVRALSVLHRGSYSRLNEAYSYAGTWLDKNGYELNGEPRESYIDGIWNKDNEDDWLTEVQLPIS